MERRMEESLAWQRLATYRDLDEFRRLKTILAPEVRRCFEQEIHEGIRRPYGAVVARDYDPEDFGELVEVADEEQLVAAADGVHNLSIVRGANREGCFG